MKGTLARALIGLAAGANSNLVANYLAGRSKIDDTLNGFACRDVGGIWDSIAAGLVATAAVNGVKGLLFGNAGQIVAQLLTVTVVTTFAFSSSCALLKLVNVLSPLRVTPQTEDAGLDLSEHGEEAHQLY